MGVQFSDLFRAETPALRRRALLLCHDWHQAEDLVQETAAIALAKWCLIRKADNPSAYLHRLLTNTFINHTRRRSYEEKPVEITIPDVVDPWPGIEDEISLAETLSILSAKERAALILRYLDDRSVSQVARTMKVSEAWVKTTCHRALAKLRRAMTTENTPAARLSS